MKKVDVRAFSEEYSLMQGYCLQPLKSTLEASFEVESNDLAYVQLRPEGDATVLLFEVGGSDYPQFDQALAKWKTILASDSFPDPVCGLSQVELDRAVAEADSSDSVEKIPDDPNQQRRDDLDSRETALNIRLDELSYDDVVKDYANQEKYFKMVQIAGGDVMEVEKHHLYITGMTSGSTSFLFSYFNPENDDSKETENQLSEAWATAIESGDSRISDAFGGESIDWTAPAVVPRDSSSKPTSNPPSSTTAAPTPTTTTLAPPASPSGGLSTGAIIGIVLGGVLVVGLLGVGIFYFIRKRKVETPSTDGTPRSPEGGV
eukprot:GHVN01035612.1.p1 GENE.GHVN01035612.1~~GHVN01035612.1.p1  ORF type:complete len:359 (+),score=45.08 GHVN01035612.1:125-1078(+)